MKKSLLILKNVSVKTNREYILRNINLDLKLEEKGRIIFLVGSSGSGKTTFLEILCDSLGEGKILSDGSVHVKTNNILYISQNSRLSFDPYFTLDEYFVMLKKSNSNLDFSPVESLDIKGFPFQHSEGQLQILQLSIAEVYNPELLLIDEPTSSLDSDLRIKIKESILKMKAKGKTVIIATHDFQFIESLKDSTDSNDLIIVLKPYVRSSNETSIDLIISIKSFFSSDILKGTYAFKLLKFYEFLKYNKVSFADMDVFMKKSNL